MTGRSWSDLERSLVLLGAANKVPYKMMGAAFGVSDAAIAGLINRERRELVQLNVHVDADMLARIDAVRGKTRRATMLRDLIEWGLEACETP